MSASSIQEIHFITGNKSKFEEASLILKEAMGVRIGSMSIHLVQKDLKVEEPQVLDQEKVVKEKAEQAFKQLGKPVICDDTAIYFAAYPSFPGTLTKFVFQSLGFKGVEKVLQGEKREAYFQTLVCYKDADECRVFKGIWKGFITPNISRMFNPDWQYNSIFIPEGFDKPLAELTMEERARYSHRKKALEQLAHFLKAKQTEVQVICTH